MKRPLVVLLLAAAQGGLAWAQDVAKPNAAEPRVERLVTQDESVRIEELRVRGQPQRIVVRPKIGPEYEILVPAPGRDPGSNRAGQRADAAGQRVWSVLKF
jgi:hypothetical protein